MLYHLVEEPSFFYQNSPTQRLLRGYKPGPLGSHSKTLYRHLIQQSILHNISVGTQFFPPISR